MPLPQSNRISAVGAFKPAKVGPVPEAVISLEEVVSPVQYAMGARLLINKTGSSGGWLGSHVGGGEKTELEGSIRIGQPNADLVSYGISNLELANYFDFDSSPNGPYIAGVVGTVTAPYLYPFSWHIYERQWPQSNNWEIMQDWGIDMASRTDDPITWDGKWHTFDTTPSGDATWPDEKSYVHAYQVTAQYAILMYINGKPWLPPNP